MEKQLLHNTEKINKDDKDVIDLVENKRKKILLNLSLMTIYIVLLVASLFII